MPMPDNGYVLSCCSTVDLTAAKLASLGIEWVPYSYEADGMAHRDDMWESRSPEEFYGEMARGADVKTSRVNAAQFREHFEKMVAQGLDVLHVTLSSGLTGSLEGAIAAAREVEQAHTGRRVVVVDSLCASSGYGLLMVEAAAQRNAGMGLDELAAWVEGTRLTVHHWFFSTDLSHYVKGGRISKAAGLAGAALRICPLLDVDPEGKLRPREKIRTKKRAMAAALQMMLDHAQDGVDYSSKAFICHSACSQDAAALARMVEGAFPHLEGAVEVFPIGPTIGGQTGPGTVSLFFLGDKRR